ncbi:MAG: biotin/lipoyl-binding protein [Methylococcales bacterium]|nr:biotin/lipoyl-binding protein [Methylococcales bacterium]
MITSITEESQPSKWLDLREDLGLYSGPRTADGTPTWTLHDPAAHRYFRLGWLEFEFLQRWGLGNAEHIIQSIQHDTPLDADVADVEAFGQFLTAHQLTKPQGAATSQLLASRRKAAQPNFLTWLLHNYLFLRIPLLRPDSALQKALPFVSVLFNRQFLTVLLLLALLALYLVSQQWTQFSHSFSYVFTAEGILSTALMLSLSKVVHELGHAFTAKHFHCRVPSMGVAFMMGFPMLWTDVTDAWRLPSRLQRLSIDAAGMIAELSLAVFATLLWTVLPDGAVRSGVYLLASTAWVLTLAVNLNPFMRFDGYYLFSDYLDIANLQDRSFALARWRLRESLFNFQLPVPEVFAKNRHRLLIAYAYGTWLYRLILFAGIAWAVYHFFFKALGVFLFAVEIGWFIVRPIIKEMAVWRELLTLQNTPLRPRVAWLIPLFAVAILFVPWQAHLLLSGLLSAETEFTLYSPQSAQVQQVLVKEGDSVQADQVLIELNSPDLDFKIATAERHLAELKEQLAAQSLEVASAQHNPMDMGALQSTLAELVGLREAQKKLTLRSHFAGRIRDLSDVLQQGEWLAKDEVIGIVQSPRATVVAYAEEADLNRLQLGATGRFYPEGGDVAPVPVHVITIDSVGTRQLTVPEISSTHGGEIAVREDEQHHLVPEQGIYRVLLQVDDGVDLQAITLRGRLSLATPAESLAGRLLRSALAVLIRESSW